MCSVTVGRKEGLEAASLSALTPGHINYKRSKNADDSLDLFQNAEVCGASCRGMILCNRLAVAVCFILSWEHWWNHSCDCDVLVFFFSSSSLQTQTLWQYRATNFRASRVKNLGTRKQGLINTRPELQCAVLKILQVIRKPRLWTVGRTRNGPSLIFLPPSPFFFYLFTCTGCLSAQSNGGPRSLSCI